MRGRPKGIPKTGGRKKGGVNKKTRLMLEKAKVRVDITPLQFMLNVMHGTAIPKNATPEVRAQMVAMQFDAAKAAAPYCHARLAAVAVHTPPSGESISNASAEVNQIEPEQRSILEIGRRIAFTLALAANEKEVV